MTHNLHHRYFPRSAYKGNIERAFRNLPCHIVRMRVEDHRELHATIAAPVKPSRERMLLVLLAHKEKRCPTCHKQV